MCQDNPLEIWYPFMEKSRVMHPISGTADRSAGHPIYLMLLSEEGTGVSRRIECKLRLGAVLSALHPLPMLERSFKQSSTDRRFESSRVLRHSSKLPFPLA